MKRQIGMVISLLLFGAALVAHGQETPSPTRSPQEATVDAAVQTLIARTQGADAQMQMTGTIQVALENALTATAQAQTLALTATPTPVPIDWSNVSVASTIDIDLMAGPGRSAAYLAPDGEHYAYLRGNTFCLYETVVQKNCIDLGGRMRGLDVEIVRWSPDSRYVSFTENFLMMLVDSDIWVWDTVENTLTDLTDDGENDFGFADDTWTGIDLAPDWTPDGRILFLRYSRVDGQIMPADIYTVTVDGQEEKIGTIQLSDPFNDPVSVYNLDVEGDQLVYIHAAPNAMPDDGVWISNLDGSNARQIIHTERDRIPFAVDLSPDGRYVLVSTIFPNNMQYEPETSSVYLVDVNEGDMRLIDPQHFVAGAGWTPQGSGLIYLVYLPGETREGGVYFSAKPGKAGIELFDSRFNVPTGRLQQSLVWGTNDVVLLSRSPMEGIVLAQMAR